MEQLRDVMGLYGAVLGYYGTLGGSYGILCLGWLVISRWWLVIEGIADPDLPPPLARPLLTWGGGGQHFIFMKTYKLDNTLLTCHLQPTL